MSWLRGSILAGTAAFGAAILPLAAGAQTFTIYNNVCDASGAIALGQDMFLLADNNSNVLRVYEFGKSDSVFEHDVAAFLGIKPGKEADIEAAARVGDLVYFITSHGLNSKPVPEHKEERLRLFAVQVSDDDPGKIADFKHPYILLLQRAMANAEYKTLLEPVAALAPERGGINIEGLAEGPDGSLYAGFRSPATAHSAIVMPILDARQTLEAAPELTVGEKAKDRLQRAEAAETQVVLGQPIIWTTLEGRGIRSMEKIGDKYLIIAGPPGNEDLTFELFSWSGKVGEQPEKVKGHKLTFADKPMLKPEVVFARPDGGLYVLSDDGDFIAAEYKKAHPDVPSQEAKCEKLDGDEKHFRGFDLEAVQ